MLSWKGIGIQLGLWMYLVAQSLVIFGRFVVDQHDLPSAHVVVGNVRNQPQGVVVVNKLTAERTFGEPDSPQRPAIVSYKPTKSIGMRIVDRAFNVSFAGMVDFCADEPEMAGDLKYFSFLKCLERFHKHRNHGNYTSIKRTTPWWFDTMIRDSRSAELHGRWHILHFPEPALRMCVAEKAGCKQWRQVHCIANNATPELTGCTPYFMGVGEAQHGVFLRDPLERFLSGFLDKCTGLSFDPHCEPLSVFMDPVTKLTSNFVSHDHRKLFEIFVDAMPLKWNFHMYPQSFYCGGLYRLIGDYDFVGTMGTNFYTDVNRFVGQYPQYQAPVRELFPEKQLGAINMGTETKAAEKVKQFYTPRTLRRVLEYMAIDYVMLDLKIPLWAEEMLALDEEELAHT